MSVKSPRGLSHRTVALTHAGWNRSTRSALETLIQRGAGQGLPVVFDFDNTLVSGDVGEATLAVLVRDGVISASRVPRLLSPPFRPPGGRVVSMKNVPDLTAYYDAFLAPTVHGDRDPSPLANGYVWAVEIMEGLRPWDVVVATRKACEAASPRGSGYIEASPGGCKFPSPVLYPAMVELLAVLLSNRFDVWVVSASNVWSVRWMVQNVINPALRAAGVTEGVRPDHVVGVSTLLLDSRAGLHKDSLLAAEDPNYAALDAKTLRRFRLTTRLQFPAPTYSGKIACIFEAIGKRPYLCAGDSPGDLPMLAYSEHRLWIARVDKPKYQQRACELIRKTGAGGWMIQPTLPSGNSGFFPDVAMWDQQPREIKERARKVLSLLKAVSKRVARR